MLRPLLNKYSAAAEPERAFAAANMSPPSAIKKEKHFCDSLCAVVRPGGTRTFVRRGEYEPSISYKKKRDP